MIFLKKQPPPLPPPKPPEPPKERIAITGIGLVSPLGATAWDTILSIHAGKINMSQFDAVLVADNEECSMLRGATVSRVDSLDARLDGVDRALALIKPAIKECIAGLPEDFLKTCTCAVENLLTPYNPQFDTGIQSAFRSLTFRQMKKEDDAAFQIPRCVFFERIISAAEALRQNGTQAALVGCVDSNVAYARLNTINKAGRLASAINRHGIVAGEAAGAVLLETETHARERGAPIYGYVASWARATETEKWTVKYQMIGHGLSDAFFEALSVFEDKGKSINRIVMDVNGEEHRAEEWAINEVRVFTRPGSEPYLSIPVFYTGDCGGASGAVVIADAVGCLMLDENAPERIALGTSDDAGARRVICLEKENPPLVNSKKVLPPEIIERNEKFKALREKYKQLTRT